MLHDGGGLSCIVEVFGCSVKCHVGLVLSHLLVGWAKVLGHAVVYWVCSVRLWWCVELCVGNAMFSQVPY